MTATPTTAQQRRRAALASWVGTTIEYYDYACYGIAASLVFADLFFPAADPLVGTLLSLASFAAGYIARPLGALVFGHLGDRLGRKNTLIFTLILMGAATFTIGVLPTYQSIGITAPALLLLARILQGVSAGGEYGGAVLMTVEHSGQKRRGFFGSLVNTGTTAGLLLANLAFLPVFSMEKSSMEAWGWRVPFLVSAILVVVGLVARLAVTESPEFAEVKQRNAVRKLPILDAFRSSWRNMVLVAFGIVASGTAFTMASVYSLAYGKDGLGLDNDRMLSVLLPATVVILICVPLFGTLADRIGLRAVFLGGAASLMVLPFIWFALLGTRHYGWMLLGFSLLLIGYSANYSVVPAYFSSVFPSEVRFSGMSIAFTTGLLGGNAIAPALSAWLLATTDGWVAIAIYMSAAAFVSLIAGLFLRVPDGAARVPAGPAVPLSRPSPQNS